jgi:hypothetical protein
MGRAKLFAAGVTVAAGVWGGTAPPKPSGAAASPKIVLPKHTAPGTSPAQPARAALGLDVGPWKPGVNQEKTRGPAADVYARVAPAVVVVRTDTGHGRERLAQVRSKSLA